MLGRFLLSRPPFLAFSLAFALPLAAQQATRDQPPPPPEATGTGRISVAVVAADTGAPVKRARVMLMGTARSARPAGTAVPPPATVTSSSRITVTGPASLAFGSGSAPPPGRVQKDGETDETGRLEFAALPAGSYSVMVSPPATFVRPTSSSGFQLGDGETVSREIRLERGGAITGRVVDESGDPVARASVSALRRDPRSTSARLSMVAAPAMTDDRGEFRVYGLAPGDYYVAANYYTPGAPSVSAPEPRIGYVPTYYPGAPSLEGARLVKVRSGQDSGGIDFGLLMGKLGRISGTLVDSSGAPLSPRSAYVSLAAKGGDQGVGFGRGSSIRPDGTFVISDVPPGDYVVYAIVTRGDMPGPQAEREAVAEPVSVNGNEVTVNLRTNTGATLSGRVVMEGTLTSPPPLPGTTGAAPAALTAGPVSIMPRPSGAPSYLPQIYAGGKVEQITEDGAFRIVGVRGSVFISAGGAGRTLKAIRRAGQDITTTPLELSGLETIDDLEVVLTYDTGNVMGSVTDGRGQPVPGAWVFAFPDDPKRWLPLSPFVRMARGVVTPAPAAGSMSPQADQRLNPAGVPGSRSPGATAGLPRAPGQFLLSRLLPGRYYLVAMESDDNSPPPFTQYDAETIAAWRRSATAVTVAVGETATVTLKPLK